MVLGDAFWEMESLGARVAYCLGWNVADMGESACGSNPNCPGDSSPSNPRPTGSGESSSGGGVGVRGGTGNGMFEAMTAT